MTPRHPATEAQIRAADPARSVWVSANAGSGKTRVLTQRVARLLIAGTEPQRILCLTYTKAAAAEMQNRLFATLGGWAMLPDAELRAALDELGLDPRDNTAAVRRRARTLFARAIETPGGLKIQTIHSFCAALLRRFPVEAGVSPRFEEMDTLAMRRLVEHVLDRMAEGEGRDSLVALAEVLPGDAAIERVAMSIADHEEAFRTATEDDLRNRAGLRAGAPDMAALLDEVFSGRAALLKALLQALETGSKTDVAAARKLAGIDPDHPRPEDLLTLENVFLYGPDTKEPFAARTARFPTKATRARLGPAAEPLAEWMERVAELRPIRLAIVAHDRARRLHRFAKHCLDLLDKEKGRRGWLGFGDLIARAARLLDDSAMAQWVLYRLDGGIDHILVDEAQDTSPEQWAVIRSLAREFTAGHGAREDTQRTLFVVGDMKQSIYSFQGADPAAFAENREHFRAALAHVGTPLSDSQLEYSFRSAPAILRAVDQTFVGDMTRGVEDSVRHRPFHDSVPGRVDLWPPIAPAEKTPPAPWSDPVDTVRPEDPAARLAETVADQIKAMLGTPLVDKDGRTRAIHEGDILVLLRRRSELFHGIIRACKARGLEVAGADRLRVGAEIAVRDLRALLSFAALPEDDLSLAEALKSPILRWTEAELFDLAARRPEGEFLWATLRRRAAEFPRTMELLDDLRAHADFERPYELLERILTRHGARRLILERLGPEAEDGIDALLSQALAYERTEVPSLTGFLEWMAEDELEIKRQLDGETRQIRVMSVHGAKGLEAPVVILPDTAARRAPPAPPIIDVDGVPMLRTGRAEAPPPILAALEAEARSREEEERRLLYVAMTRAERWLIVAAAGDVGADGKTWHNVVQAGLERAGALPFEAPTGPGLRLADPGWPSAVDEGGISEATETAPAMPDWLRTPAPPVARPPAPLSPSALGGAKTLGPGDETIAEGDARLHGELVHRLLEVLPGSAVADWKAIAAAEAERLGLAEGAPAAAALDEARRVLEAPSLKILFTPDALAEVEVAGRLPGIERPFRGTIDRLVAGPDRVLVADFKTNRLVPERPEDVPPGILAQLAAYRALVARVFPDRPVEAAVVWTRTASLMPIDPKLLDAVPLVADATG